MIDRIEAGRRLKHARESRGLSQEAAAKVLGMPRQQLSQLENGRRIPAWTTLVEIVGRLGLAPESIVPEWFAGGAAE